MAKSGYISITQDSQSIINNASTITVKGIITTSGESWRGDARTGTYSIYQGGTLIKSGSFTHGAPANSTTTLFSVTLTVSHDTSGKFGMITASYNYDSGWCTGSGSLSLAQIKRASVPTLSAGTVGFGEAITITTNRQTDTFYHHLYYSINGGDEVGLHGYVLDSYTWTVPLSLMNSIPNATSATIRFRLYTFTSENVNIGNNTITFTVTVPSDVVPSCDLSITDTEGYEDIYGALVQGWSKLKIEAEPVLAYGSEIASYKISADGKIYTEASVTTDEIQSSGELKITADLTDKRGRTGSVSVEKTVLEYRAPVISLLKVLRCNADGQENAQGEYVKVTFSASVTSLNELNTAVYRLEYKKTADTEFTQIDLSNLEGAYTVTGSETIFEAYSGSSYQIRLTVVDSFGATDKTVPASTGICVMHFHKTGRGVGIGKISELEDVCDIGLQTRMDGGILHPVLEDETDLDTVQVPNKYVMTAENDYVNAPEAGINGILEVEGCENDHLTHRIYVISKTDPKIYERYFYEETWSGWNTRRAASGIATITGIQDLAGITGTDITTLKDLTAVFEVMPDSSVFVAGLTPTDTYAVSLADSDGNLPSAGEYGLLEIVKYSDARNTIRMTRCTYDTYNNIISETHYVREASTENKIAPWLEVANSSKPQMTGGSTVINTAADKDSAILLSLTNVRNLFGHTDTDPKNYSFVVTNGDGTANSAHIEGVTYQDPNYYVVLRDKQTSASSLRVNYVIFYTP